MGTEARRAATELSIACGLGGKEQQERKEELSREFFSSRLGTE